MFYPNNLPIDEISTLFNRKNLPTIFGSTINITVLECSIMVCRSMSKYPSRLVNLTAGNKRVKYLDEIIDQDLSLTRNQCSKIDHGNY